MAFATHPPSISSKPLSLISQFQSPTPLFFPFTLPIHSCRQTHLITSSARLPINTALSMSSHKLFVSRFAIDQPRKGSDILVEALERQGVTNVFADPGGNTHDIPQSLASSSIIRTTLPRHEQGGVFASQGYARASGFPGVCIATSDPVAINLITGILDVLHDSNPIIAIAGQVSHQLIGQETPIVELTRSITKHNYQILKVEDIPRIVHEAFYLATSGRPGPVLIDIPIDILQQLVVPNWDQPMRLAGYMSKLPKPVEKSHLEQILRLISESKKPVIYVGGGCLASFNELRRFVELSGIPVASTLMGFGSFPGSNKLSLQMLGMHESNYSVDKSDLLLAFGVCFNDSVTGMLQDVSTRAKIVHIDIGPSELGKNNQLDISINGDIKLALHGLNKILEERNLDLDLDLDFSSWRHEINEQKTNHPLTFETSGDEISPQYAIQVLEELKIGNEIITMGFGLPEAMGASIAKPDGVVVDIDSHESFIMNLQELATIRVENLPVKVMLLNNQYLGNPLKESEIFPDMVKFAEGCDIPGARVTKKHEVKSAIKEMLDTPGPYLLDIVILHQEQLLTMIRSGGMSMDVIRECDGKRGCNI